jgi:Protein of unknown function (DUF2490)
MQIKAAGIGAAVLMLGFMAAPGGARAAATEEFWPELDLWYRFTDAWRLEFVSTGTRDDSGDKTDGSAALYVDYRMNDPISWRVGFQYQNTLPDSPGQNNTVEHRVSLDFNYRWHLGDEVLMTDRTRLDFRDIESVESYRVRNRLRLERPFKLTRTTLTPYFNAEVYYDTRYDAAVTRLRLEAGSIVSLGKIWEADFYIGGQRNYQPTDKNTVALGITITGNF